METTKKEIETSCQLFLIVEDQQAFEPVKSINQENGEFMQFDLIEDSYDGIFPRISDYTRLANRIDTYGISEFLTWISTKKSKKLIADNSYCTIERTSKWDTEAIMIFKDPINVVFGYVNDKPIIKEVNKIIGEFSYEWFWRKNGRQNKIANGFEVWFNCKEYLFE